MFFEKKKNSESYNSIVFIYYFGKLPVGAPSFMLIKYFYYTYASIINNKIMEHVDRHTYFLTSKFNPNFYQKNFYFVLLPLRSKRVRHLKKFT